MLPTRFFNFIKPLHQYSLQLGHGVQGVECEHCLSTDQWVSHGFVYKKDYGGDPKVVGKRVLCSNRGFKKGCGRTLRLYLAERTPRIHYSVIRVFVFMTAMLTMTIQQAYQKATSCNNARNAYRWIQKLMVNTTRHRAHIANQKLQTKPARSKQVALIGETYSGLKIVFNSGENYQIRTQEAFLML